VVAVASARPRLAVGTSATWYVAALAVVVIGIGARLIIGGPGIGERSAVVMMVLLAGCAWLAALVVAGRRVALVVVLVATLLFDVAALPLHDQPAYDDLQAFYATDQVLSATIPVTPGGASAINLLVQPVFTGPQPRFGLAGDVNGTAYQWTCPFAHGIQTLVLPASVSGNQAEVNLRLTGSPSHDGDYLIAYISSRLGGFVVSSGSAGPSATHCSLT
jgi:hypothetical protein